MIKKLTGIHETADFRTNTTFCLYHNNEYENYPPHWHTPFEVIMPILNGYTVDCGKHHYELKESDILIICPCVIHELSAPKTGERIIFQPGLAPIGIKELDFLISRISPAFLITKETQPCLHKTVSTLLLEISEEYDSSRPFYETSIYYRFLQILVEIGRCYTPESVPADKGFTKKDYMDKFLIITNGSV